MSEEQNYAIIETGGKQYRVSPGQKISVEKIKGEIGSEVSFSKVLLVGGSQISIGSPYVEGASVSAKILGVKKGRKIRIFKKKIKTGFSRRQGHRQSTSELLIESVKTSQ